MDIWNKRLTSRIVRILMRDIAELCWVEFLIELSFATQSFTQVWQEHLLLNILCIPSFLTWFGHLLDDSSFVMRRSY